MIFLCSALTRSFEKFRAYVIKKKKFAFILQHNFLPTSFYKLDALFIVVGQLLSITNYLTHCNETLDLVFFWLAHHKNDKDFVSV